LFAMRAAVVVTSSVVTPQATKPINNAHTSVLALADIVIFTYFLFWTGL